MRVIDENGGQLGIMSSKEAYLLARDRGYDLVAIAPAAAPPVCRIVDLGKYIYEQGKKEKESKKKQTKVEIKQMRYRLKIDSGDLAIKNRKIREFLEDGNRVNIAIWFRGREMAFTDKGFDLANKIIGALHDVAVVTAEPKMAGRNLVFNLEPNKEMLKKAKERRDNPLKRSMDYKEVNPLKKSADYKGLNPLKRSMDYKEVNPLKKSADYKGLNPLKKGVDKSDENDLGLQRSKKGEKNAKKDENNKVSSEEV